MNMTNKCSDLEDYIPIFIKKNNIIRKNFEDSKNYIIMPKGEKIFLNNVAFEILELCNGKNNINYIIKEIYTQYAVEKDIVIKDIIEHLYKYWRMGLVVWVGRKNPFSVIYEKRVNDKIMFKNLYGDDINEKVVKNIKHGLKDVTLDDDIYFLDSTILNNVRQGNNYYFSLEIDNNISALIGIRANISFVPAFTILNYNIDYLYVDNKQHDLISKYFDDFLSWIGLQIEDNFNFSALYEKNVFIMKVSNSEDNMHFLLNNKFYKIGEINKETHDESICYFVKKVNVAKRDNCRF